MSYTLFTALLSLLVVFRQNAGWVLGQPAGHPAAPCRPAGPQARPAPAP